MYQNCFMDSMCKCIEINVFRAGNNASMAWILPVKQEKVFSVES